MALPITKKRSYEEVREAAEFLSYAYRLRGKPLPSALTHATVEHDIARELSLAEWALQPAGTRDESFFPITMANYLAALRIVKEEVRAFAVDAGGKALDRQIKELTSFVANRLAREEIAVRIHEIAENVRTRMNGFYPSARDQEQAEKKYGPASVVDRNSLSSRPNPEFFKGTKEFYRERLRAELAAELQSFSRGSAADRSRPTPTGQPSQDLRVLRKEAADACVVLSLHPELEKILEYYAQSADLGTRLARKLVTDALAASAQFAAMLYASDDMVWRYSPLIVLGVQQLGLDDIDGFTEFATDFGYVLGEDQLGNALTVLGFATFILGLLLTGPLAAAGLSFVDLALTGAALPLTFLREREQEVAATSGAFSTSQFAKRREYPYAGTAFAGFAALLSGIALVISGVRLASSLQPHVRGKPPPRPDSSRIGRSRVKLDPTSTQGASGVSPKSRARYREMPSSVTEANRFRPRRGYGTRTPPDKARAVASGGVDEPLDASPVPLSKPAAIGPGSRANSDIAVASASRPGTSKSPVLTKGPTTTPGSTSASKDGARPKPSAKKSKSAAKQDPYNPRKAAEAIVLQNEAEIWAYRADYRGLYIQSKLAKTEYASYFEPNFRNKPEIDDWWPIVDFVSKDEKHVVSLKTYDPHTRAANQDVADTFEVIQQNAQEMVDYNWPKDVRGTLEIRIPPGSSPAVTSNLLEALGDFIGKGTIKLKVVIKTYP